MFSAALVVTFYATCALALFFLPVRQLLGSCFFHQDGSRITSYAYLDVVRGLAALSVLLMHYYIWSPTSLGDFGSVGLISGGQKAVGVFFVLSSFLIWKSLRLDQIGSYEVSRILRIYPLHIAITFFLFLPANAFFTILFHGDTAELSSFWQTNAAAFKEAMLWNVFTNNFSVLNGVAWSIVIEMQFYVAAPLLKYVHAKFPGFFVVALACASAGLLWLESNAALLGIKIPQLPWAKFFIAGIFLAIFIDRLVNSRLLRSSYVSAACIVAAVLIIDLDFNNIRVVSYILPLGSLTFSPDLAFGVCLLIVGLRANPHAASLFARKPVRFLGVISYSFYLSQLPILGQFLPDISASAHPMAFVVLFAVPVHVVVSALLFLVVETPFLMLSGWIKARSQNAGRGYPGTQLQYGLTRS